MVTRHIPRIRLLCQLLSERQMAQMPRQETTPQQTVAIAETAPAAPATSAPTVTTPQQQTKATADAAQEAPATPTPAATIPRQQATTTADTPDLPTFLAIFQIRLAALNKTGDQKPVITALVDLSIDFPAR